MVCMPIIPPLSLSLLYFLISTSRPFHALPSPSNTDTHQPISSTTPSPLSILKTPSTVTVSPSSPPTTSPPLASPPQSTHASKPSPAMNKPMFPSSLALSKPQAPLPSQNANTPSPTPTSPASSPPPPFSKALVSQHISAPPQTSCRRLT